MSRPKKRQFTHLLIKQTAIKFAGEFYEYAAHDDLFYKYYPDFDFFVRKEWGRFLDIARRHLVELLKSNLPDVAKEDIFDALIKERTLPRGDTAIMPMETLH